METYNMPLRNGKTYLISHMCQSCDRNYHSNPKFDYKCSVCWGYCEKNGIMTGKDFGNKCIQWSKDNIVGPVGKHFILKNRHISDQHLFNFLTEILENTGKYISAESAMTLFKANPTNNRGHIVGSFIADWWNIKSENVNNSEKKWPAYMACYYGNYNESIFDWWGVNHASIPPKKPRGPLNDFINNKIMMNINYL